MSALVRLIDGGGDPLEGELLRAALRESATDESRARVARALGLPLAAASSLGASSADASGGRPASAAAPAGSTAQLAGVRLGALAKYSLLGVFGGLVMFAGHAAWQAHGGAAPAVATSPPAPTLPPVTLPRDVLQPAPDSEHLTRPAPALAQRAPRRATRAAVSTEDRLLAEVRQLDRARSALRNGEPARVLQLLDEYAAAFPHGELMREAAQLRARAEQTVALEIRGSQGARRDIGAAR